MIKKKFNLHLFPFKKNASRKISISTTQPALVKQLAISQNK